MTKKDFEKIVEETIADLPEEFRAQLDNVEIVIDTKTKDPSLLGLYYGVPKTERYHYSSLPDKITIYKKVIETSFSDSEEIVKQIRQTVLHEIGHHFGLSDQAMDNLRKNY